MTNNQQTYPLIDLARFILSLIIAIFHICVLYRIEFPNAAIQYVLMCGTDFVAVFFVLSGFFAVRKLDAIGEGKQGYERFLGGRLIRLMPLVALSTMTLFLLSSLHVGLFNECWCSHPFSFGRLVLNLTGMSVLCGDTEPISGPTWFISVLLFCNILFYFISSRKIPKSTKYTIFLFLTVLGIGLMDADCNFPFLYPRMGCGYCALFSGVLFGSLYPMLPAKTRRISLIAGTALILFTGVVMGYGSSVVSNLYLFFALCGAPLLILAAGELQFSGLPARVCRFLERISYSVYVWNLPILIGAAILCRLFGLMPFNGSWICLGVYAGIHTLIASLSFLLLEQPLTNWLNKKLEQSLLQAKAQSFDVPERIAQ